jgi:hypothetical protein
VRDIHHGIQESNRRPVLDIRPINGLSRQMEAYHNDDKKYHHVIEVKLNTIAVDDGNFGSQMREMRNDFKEAFEIDKLQREANNAQIEKMDALTKIAGGALIISGIIALGTFGWEIVKTLIKMGVGRKANSHQVLNTTSVGKQLHARSWNHEGSSVRAKWD